MADATLVPPEQSDPVSLSDWIELALILNGTTRFSRTALRRSLRDVVTDDVADLGFVNAEVERRRRIVGSAYPYVVDGTGIKRTSKQNSWYEFLLVASHPNTSFRREKQWSGVNSHFDQATMLALKSYLGPSSEGVVFAWPVNGTRPQNFPEAIAWLAGQLDLSVGAAKLSPNKKDGGVDVVVWRGFNDRRSAFSAVLAQCTVRTSYSSKSHDIVPTHWASYITFGAHPQTSLSVPHIVATGSDEWDDMHYSCQVLLDRLRLTLLLADIPITSEIQDWTSAQLAASAS